MQDVFAQDGPERDVRAAEVRRVREVVCERCGDDELRRPEEGPEVAVEVVPLLARLAAGRRPQLHRVGGDAHVDQAAGRGQHQHQAAHDHHGRVAHAERAPRAEEEAQGVLEALAQRLTARGAGYKEADGPINTAEGGTGVFYYYSTTIVAALQLV